MVPSIVPSASDVPMVAYVQGGDIWVRAVPSFANRFSYDGNAVRLTFDGRNQSPRWSANGQMISFVKNPDSPELWVIRRDGSVVSNIGPVASWDSYDWSPVEDKLVLAGHGSIRLYDISTDNGTRLTGNIDIGQPSSEERINKVFWSPNGQYVAFTLFSQASGAEDEGRENDGLWVIDIASGLPERVLASDVPEKGEFILHGWSGDGENLLYSQAPVLSASILSDGVPLYSVPAFGGEPELLSEAVVPHDDSIQAQPNGLGQVVFVEGSGREMWHNKRLRAAVVGSNQVGDLSADDQAVTSPAWSPDGNAISYIGMPDVEEVSGGDEAQVALMNRNLWIIDANEEPRLVENLGGRIESPHWIDNETLLVAVISLEGRVQLMKVNKAGNISDSVTGEITPAPEWFGYYGYIDWSNYFAMWRPPTAAASDGTLALQPTAVPYDPYNRKLVNFLQALHPEMTSDEALSLFGEPDDITGSGLLIYQYSLNDSTSIWLAFPGQGPLTYAQLHTPTGKVFGLDFLVMNPTPATYTPTPASMDAAPLTPTIVPPTAPPPEPMPEATATPTPAMEATATPLPTTVPPGSMPGPTATPDRFVVTLTPTPAAEETATPLPTAPMPEPTATPLPATPALATPTPIPQ
jgi:dipeptidyl aminopeptidase/acylaminoacyl peptidase